ASDFHAKAAAQGPSEFALDALVDSIAQAAVGSGQAAGLTVAVSRGPTMLVRKAYGFADLEQGIATSTDAIYEIGSITKQFTAAAILKLVESGSIRLDDRIDAFLPSYPQRGRGITLRQLLHHTAGIPDFTEMPEFGELVRRAAPRDSIAALFGS